MRASIARVAAAVGTVAASAILAAPALAADQKATLSTAKKTFAWNGGPGFGAFATSDVTSRLGCDAPGYDCEYIQLTLANPGDLQVDLSWSAPNTQDIDLHIYFADSAGKPDGDPLAESVAFNPQDGAGESATAFDLTAGKYVAVVDYYLAVAGSYTGKASLIPTGAAAASSSSKASRRSKAARRARR
jgi:hypothetical protein